MCSMSYRKAEIKSKKTFIISSGLNSASANFMLRFMKQEYSLHKRAITSEEFEFEFRAVWWHLVSVSIFGVMHDYTPFCVCKSSNQTSGHVKVQSAWWLQVTTFIFLRGSEVYTRRPLERLSSLNVLSALYFCAIIFLVMWWTTFLHALKSQRNSILKQYFFTADQLPKLPSQCYSNGLGNWGNLGINNEICPSVLWISSKLFLFKSDSDCQTTCWFNPDGV